MIEKILERLEVLHDLVKDNQKLAVSQAISIVQEVAKEYGNGWIPVETELPKDFRGVLITAIALNGTSYTEIGKWNGNQWFHGASNTRIDIAEVIAWMELPAPYQKGE